MEKIKNERSSVKASRPLRISSPVRVESANVAINGPSCWKAAKQTCIRKKKTVVYYLEQNAAMNFTHFVH